MDRIGDELAQSVLDTSPMGNNLSLSKKGKGNDPATLPKFKIHIHML